MCQKEKRERKQNIINRKTLKEGNMNSIKSKSGESRWMREQRWMTECTHTHTHTLAHIRTQAHTRTHAFIHNIHTNDYLTKLMESKLKYLAICISVKS